MKDQLRKFLTGIDIKQEYVCLALEDITDTFSVFLTTRHDDQSLDVTASHRFLGYSPLLMAVPFANEDTPAARATDICLSFTANDSTVDCKWREFPSSQASVARLHLKRIVERRVGETFLVFYEGTLGWHRLLGAFHRMTNRWLQQIKRKPAGNVSLGSNLYEQVRIAYSLPRIISLVSVGDGARMNLFPTDLHGPVGDGHYVSSLRVGGRACEQVEHCRRIAISEVNATAYKAVYRLGKNHMKPMDYASAFELHTTASATWAIALPAAVVHYRELEWYDCFDWGIHRLYCYRTVYSRRVSDFKRLAHVHNCYAQWRNDAGLRTEYLLR